VQTKTFILKIYLYLGKYTHKIIKKWLKNKYLRSWILYLLMFYVLSYTEKNVQVSKNLAENNFIKSLK